jgi:hypothetical protein
MVLGKLSDTTLSHEEKRIMGDILLNLQEHENVLINFTLQDMVDKINESNIALKSLITQMENASHNISSISNTIKKISGVLSTLTEITTKAMGAGLLG